MKVSRGVESVNQPPTTILNQEITPMWQNWQVGFNQCPTTGFLLVFSWLTFQPHPNWKSTTYFYSKRWNNHQINPDVTKLASWFQSVSNCRLYARGSNGCQRVDPIFSQPAKSHELTICQAFGWVKGWFFRFNPDPSRKIVLADWLLVGS